MRTFIHKSRFAGRRHGFAILEVLLCLIIFSAIMALLTSIMTSAVRLEKKSSIAASVENDGRLAMDAMMADVQSAKSVVSDYTARTGGNYKSNLSDTLVLCLPAYSSGGNSLDGRSDYIIYRVITNSTDGTSVLQRIIDADPQSARYGGSPRIIARNVSSLRLTYLVHQATVSNGLDLHLGLDAGVFGTGADLVQNLTIGGKPFIIGTNGQASVVSSGVNAVAQTLVMVQPPQNNVVVDLLYSVAPWLLPQNVNVTTVAAELHLVVDHPSLRPATQTTLAINSNAMLRNR